MRVKWTTDAKAKATLTMTVLHPPKGNESRDRCPCEATTRYSSTDSKVYTCPTAARNLP